VVERRKFPDRIEVYRDKNGMGIRIDGDLFPWFTVDGYHVDVTKDQVPSVTVTIPAMYVTVVDGEPLPDKENPMSDGETLREEDSQVARDMGHAIRDAPQDTPTDDDECDHIWREVDKDMVCMRCNVID